MNNDPFNPASEYTPPKSGGRYLKLEKGSTKFLPLTSPIIGWQYWNTENKPVRLKEAPKGNLGDLEGIRKEDSGKFSVKHFWAFPVIDVADGEVKVLEITQQSVQQAIRAYATNPDWGSPVMKYTFTIKREGDGFDTEYTVMANPLGAVSEDWRKAWNETVEFGFDLNELFTGGDPFAPKTKPAGHPETVAAAPAPSTAEAAEIRQPLPEDTATPPN